MSAPGLTPDYRQGHEDGSALGWRLGIGFARGASGDASLGWLVAIGFFLLWLTDSNLGRVIAAWLIQFAS